VLTDDVEGGLVGEYVGGIQDERCAGTKLGVERGKKRGYGYAERKNSPN